jgi:transposase
MLFGRTPRRVLAYRTPVDMRKSFNGLHAVAREAFTEDVLSGAAFVFVNRTKTIIKILMWDRTGWCVIGKRLERGRFEIGGEELNLRELELLFDGICRRNRVHSS